MSRVVKRSVNQENYEHVLMCLICRSLFDDHDHQPKFLPCHHTFCKECLREYVRQMGDDIECPSCRKAATIPAAGVAALQTNFYAKYIQSLVYGCGGAGGDGLVSECEKHPTHTLQYLCRDCARSICDSCLREDGCTGHKLVSLTTATEEYHHKIDASFARANTLIERKKVELEALLKALSEEKDQSLLKIDSTFEQYVHTLNRRATLLKNKVIDIYNEDTAKLDADLEEISTAMTCVVSLKEFHETRISRGDFTDVESGIEELDEVCRNIQDRIKPSKNQILFEDKHGADKFRGCIKDLGRVICKATKPVNRPEEDGCAVPATPPPSPVVTPNKPSDGDETNPGGYACAAAVATAYELPEKPGNDLSKLSETMFTQKERESKKLSEDLTGKMHNFCDEMKPNKKCDSSHESSSYGGHKTVAKVGASRPPDSDVKSCSNNNRLPSTEGVGFRNETSQRGARDVGTGDDLPLKPDCWMAASSSLDSINAEMSPEQTTL